jgi:predicted TIM-barrel fold metal-dependent hydrolase
LLAVALCCLAGVAPAADAPPPIIDMHLHALPLAFFEQILGPAPIPHCVPMTDYEVPADGSSWGEVMRSRDLDCAVTRSPGSDQAVLTATLEIMQRHNIFGVTSGPLLEQWRGAAEKRFIPAFAFAGGAEAPSPDAMRAAFESGGFEVLAEVTVQYLGIAPDDPSMESYWALAEDLDIPVGIHVGTGPLGAPYLGFDGYRGRLHSPLLLEEVLVRHPELRVYVMHAGWPMLDDLLALLWTHPQVYVGLGVIDWALPTAEFHRYLRRIVEAGFGKRVLFGTDQMVWPAVMERAIESIRSAEFLSPAQKRDILFGNAVRFLRLSPDRVAAMQDP